MCCGTDKNVSADDRKGMILQARFKVHFKHARISLQKPLYAPQTCYELLPISHKTRTALLYGVSTISTIFCVFHQMRKCQTMQKRRNQKELVTPFICIFQKVKWDMGILDFIKLFCRQIFLFFSDKLVQFPYHA